MIKLFNDEEVALFEKINLSTSRSIDKLEGFKEVIEPAKVKAMNYWDPFFGGKGTWQCNGGKYGDDLIWHQNGKPPDTVEYKLAIRTFSDPVFKTRINIFDYCVLSYEQFKRYCKEPDRKILFERCVINFDTATQVGSDNVRAFDFASETPVQSWYYLLFDTNDIKRWRYIKDYYYASATNKECLVVFKKTLAKKIISLDNYLVEATNKGVFLTKSFNYANDQTNVDMDDNLWAFQP